MHYAASSLAPYSLNVSIPRQFYELYIVYISPVEQSGSHTIKAIEIISDLISRSRESLSKF